MTYPSYAIPDEKVEEIRRLLKLGGQTQRSIAEKVGVSSKSVSAINTGKYRPGKGKPRKKSQCRTCGRELKLGGCCQICVRDEEYEPTPDEIREIYARRRGILEQGDILWAWREKQVKRYAG